MKESIKLYAKISGKAFLKWFLVVASGIVITLVFFFIILFSNASGAGGGHGNPFALLISLALEDVFGLLLFAGAPIFIILYFLIANKVAIHTVIYEIWTNKAVVYVEPAVQKIAEKITSKQNWISTVSDQAMLRAKLLDANKNDKSTSTLNRRVLNYAFKKIKLDDIDFQNEKLTLADILTLKLKNFISESAKPSFNLYWILIGIQVVLLICSMIFS